MKLLSLTVSVVLTVIADFHILWGFRIWIPVSNESQLAKTVAGFSGIEFMPSSAACFFVALCLLGAVLIVLTSAGQVKFTIVSRKTASIAAFPFATVFLGRGGIAYTEKWAAITPEMPFRQMDKLYYGPLCLFLGLAILIIGISTLRSINAMTG